MRVRQRDGPQAAMFLHAGDGVVVEQGDAVPEHVAGGGLDQVGLLANAKIWLGHDGGDAGGKLAERIAVLFA